MQIMAHKHKFKNKLLQPKHQTTIDYSKHIRTMNLNNLISGFQIQWQVGALGEEKALCWGVLHVPEILVVGQSNGSF
jgi:hypothetical protein